MALVGLWKVLVLHRRHTAAQLERQTSRIQMLLLILLRITASVRPMENKPRALSGQM